MGKHSWTVAGLLAAAVPLAVSPAAPIPPDHLRVPLYFPTTAGAKWVYRLDDSIDSGERTDIVTKVERGPGVEATVSVGSVGPDGEVHPSGRYVVSAQGVLQVEGLGIRAEHPKWLLKLPYKANQTWETDDGSVLFPERKSTHTSAEEKVTVPAGTYTAIRVTTRKSEVGLMPPVKPIIYWYAPGVGAVKITAWKSTLVLKSFDPGGG